ncbi:BON domain-containing protein [Rhodoferax sp.]|uniref:BON domain-containing protein n=1 Tax=Rhodoferax sp. TaxID=50421 RepID=UPI00374D31AD
MFCWALCAISNAYGWVLAGLLLVAPVSSYADEALQNYFNDPFLQVTAAIASCPPQAGPRISRAEMQAETHWRAERGTSCYRAGRCRLPNAYLYDAEIIPRARQAILADGRFADTSIWVEGQRRWVWLKGCVRSSDQSLALERLVRNIDDVEAVINELTLLPP